MKSIIFVRHSKSSWESFSIPDHDRPLNNRGQKDSVFMGKKLKQSGYFPEVIISSTAKRAMKTAKNIAKELGIENIVSEAKLYLAPPHIFMQVISKLNDKVNTIMLVAHNPAMTDIVNAYSDEYIHNIPTTGIFKISFDVDSWEEVSFENGLLIDFIYPKLYKDEK